MTRIVNEFKDRKGKWVPYFKFEGKRYYTHSGQLYYAVKSRCKAGGAAQRLHKTYIGCVLNFKDYQDFAEWCNNQIGFNRPNYQLDKDILFKGNKIYSKDTCVFIPQELNLLMVKSNAIRGKHPIGVSWNKAEKVFKSYISIDDKFVSLGSYSTSESAFKAHKTAKENRIKFLADKYKEVISSSAYDALYKYEVEITD